MCSEKLNIKFSAVQMRTARLRTTGTESSWPGIRKPLFLIDRKIKSERVLSLCGYFPANDIYNNSTLN